MTPQFDGALCGQPNVDVPIFKLSKRRNTRLIIRKVKTSVGQLSLESPTTLEFDA
jgi:hypothetical protein